MLRITLQKKTFSSKKFPFIRFLTISTCRNWQLCLKLENSMTTFPYVKDNGNRLLKKLKVDMIMELGNNILDKVDKEFNLKKYK